MINIDVLNGFRPRFHNAVDCNGVTIPTVDNSSTECEEFHMTNCLKTSTNYSFFSIAANETLTSAFTKISNKVKAILDKFRTVIDYSALVEYANDSAAGSAGLTTGMPYKDPNGFVRVKL
jgi:hypothetical protein